MYFIIFIIITIPLICTQGCGDINNYLEIENIFLIPELSVPSKEYLRYRYLDGKLYLVDNSLSFSDDTVSFNLRISNSSTEYDSHIIKFPNQEYSNHIFIYDLIKDSLNIYFLIDGNILIFQERENNFKFLKSIPLKYNCTDIIKVENEKISLTSILFVKNQNQNFLYKIDTKTLDEEYLIFSETGNEQLVNVGGRKNKVFLNDTLLIHSKIIDYTLIVESNTIRNEKTIQKADWESLILKTNKRNKSINKVQLMDIYEKLHQKSSILNLFAMDNKLFVQYYIIRDNQKLINFDMFEINQDNYELSMLEQNIENTSINEDNTFSINNMKVSGYLLNKDNYLLDIVKFPFDKKNKFKSKEEFLEKRNSEVLETGLQYSIIVRKLK